LAAKKITSLGVYLMQNNVSDWISNSLSSYGVLGIQEATISEVVADWYELMIIMI